MRVLNDHKGNANGKVILTYKDCELLNSALFYLKKEETLDDRLEGIRILQVELKFIMNELRDSEDYNY